MVFEQRAGEVCKTRASSTNLSCVVLQMLVVPHGWFAQWFSTTETLGTVTQLLNEKNFDVVLSEIMKVQDQVPQWLRVSVYLRLSFCLFAAEISNLLHQVNWSDLPLELESLAPERQVRLHHPLLQQTK